MNFLVLRKTLLKFLTLNFTKSTLLLANKYSSQIVIHVVFAQEGFNDILDSMNAES